MKHLFIVNPVAGGKDSTDAVSAAVAKAFSGRPEDYEIYITRAPMDAGEKIIRESQLCDELRVYACGGDGTLNECVCGAAGRENVAVTHFPTGTGNDFIKTFGAEKEGFFDLEKLISGEVRKFDVIDCNGRSCLSICSLGVDARIGMDVHKYSSLPVIGGATGYVTSLAVNFVKGITENLRIVCNGKLYYGKTTLVCICNGTCYGGGFNPVPEARPDDGVLDVLIVKGVSRAKFLAVVGAYSKGRYAEHSDIITHLQTTELTVESEKEMVVNVDGEAVYGTKFSVRLQPGALNFIVPKGMHYFEQSE